jgi:hypothetical protein
MSFSLVDRVPRQVMLWLGGSVALAVGMLIYLCDRPASHVSLLPHIVYLSAQPLFGRAGGWLPSFVHPLAFSLFCAGLLAPHPRLQYGACAFWFAVNAAFEVGQHPQIRGLVAVRLGTDRGPITRSIQHYVERGTFDAADLVAAAVGAALAASILHRLNISAFRHHEP